MSQAQEVRELTLAARFGEQPSMLHFLPFAAAIVLVLLAERNWQKRPLRRETDAIAYRVMWTITAIGLASGVAMWAAVLLIEPSLVGGRVWVGGLAWLLATVAAGKFAMWPVAWRIAESGVPDGDLPSPVLWAASACVWFGIFRLVGAAINWTMAIPDIPLDALLFLFGGSGVLERSRGWRICLLVLWGMVGLVGLGMMASALLAIGGVGRGPVLRAGSSELDSPALAVVFAAAMALIGLTLAAALAGVSVREWCTVRSQTGDACPKCGYNLAGLEGKGCPECGMNGPASQPVA